MMTAANDNDLRDALLAWMGRARAHANRATLPMTDLELAQYRRDEADIVAKGQVLHDAQRQEIAQLEAQVAELRRRCVAAGIPTIRRVVTDTHGDTVIF